MNLDEIKGIGPKTIELLFKLNISNIMDLLSYYPYRYNYLKPTTLLFCVNEPGLVNAKVIEQARVSYIKRNLNRLSFKVLIENQVITVTIFNRAFLKPQIIINKDIALIGKFNQFKSGFIASDIFMYNINKTSIEPLYHLIKGLNNKQINKIILNVLNSNIEVEDYIPKNLNIKYKFLPKINALSEIHNPTNSNLLKQAKLKLIYEEFFIFMFKMNYLKIKRIKQDNGLSRKVDYSLITNFINDLPYKLTNDQLSATKEIYHDLTTPKRMNRLLLGDVGTGKTIVSIIALYINYLAHYQGVLMAPTEILATQHYQTLTQLLPDLKVALLVGSLTKKAKSNIIKQLANNEIDILVGTHAILSDDVNFNNLGLVVTDEQHRFGVNQRKAMQNKGIKTDILYASATPIPRTYALSLYGDMDLSLIKDKPMGRKEIITKVKKAIIHGKMKKEEKKNVINAYQENKIQILISTTVIEVGIDIKNSTRMIIYNAERFGLATLHQLRGRVGRNYYQSYCYLICNNDIPRLRVLEESNDGFYISEKDLELRGEGDLFGINRSGDMAFKIGNITSDSKIMLQCQKDALDYLNNFDNNIFYQKIMSSLDINN